MFSPEDHAKGKSHFQAAFWLLPSTRRRQALADLYAFCRLADDLADDESQPLAARTEGLERLRLWITNDLESDHPFWKRFRIEIRRYAIPPSSLLGILDGVTQDLTRKEYATWKDLDEYCTLVASCVGEATLAILDVRGPEARHYAYQLGHCVQYLNIMRDLEEDRAMGRQYVPHEISKSLTSNNTDLIRHELYNRALHFWKNSHPPSYRCLLAEVLVGIYLEGAKKYWRFGHSQRLSKHQKIRAMLKTLAYFPARILLRRSKIPAPSNL